MERTGFFGLSVLADGQDELAFRFAGKGDDKFAGVGRVSGELEQPLLEGALAHLECEVTELVRAGTHVVYIAEVLAASVGTGLPLAYFRGRFGGIQLPS